MKRFSPTVLLAAMLWAIALLLVGCATQEKLPAVKWHDPQDALRLLRERAAAIQTVSAEGLITMERPDGQSVRMDMAMVTKSPDYLRLRTWKLSRAIFDLTLTPDGLWLLTPDDPSLRDKVESSGVGAGQLARSWALLSGEIFNRPGVTIVDAGGKLIVTARVDEMTVRCEIDRRSLVPRRYVLLDQHGVARFTLEPSAYQMFGEIAYATRYSAVSDSGRILIALRDVELNGELSAEAFKPPRRAEKMP